jgi:hypothetical protein
MTSTDRRPRSAEEDWAAAFYGDDIIDTPTARMIDFVAWQTRVMVASADAAVPRTPRCDMVNVGSLASLTAQRLPATALSTLRNRAAAALLDVGSSFA